MKNRLSQDEFLRLRDLFDRNHTLIEEQISIQSEIAGIMGIQISGPSTETMYMQSMTLEMWLDELHISVEG